MSRLRIAVSERDHVDGRLDAPVVLVEYGDYQCPHCADAQPVVAEVLLELGDHVAFVFRHFPLSVMHPRAARAAAAAEAAGTQASFWPMHEALFDRGIGLEDEHLVHRARALGLDLDRFRRTLDSAAVAATVRQHFEGGVRSGVNATPTFFLNGRRHDGPADAKSLIKSILCLEPVGRRR